MSVAELQAQLKIAKLELELAQAEAARGHVRKSTDKTATQGRPAHKTATRGRPARKRAPFDKEKFSGAVRIGKIICGRGGIMHPQTHDREFPDTNLSDEIAQLAEEGFKPAVRLHGALRKARRQFDKDGKVPAILFKSEWQNYQVIPAADVVMRDSIEEDDGDTSDAESAAQGSDDDDC
jgi:hypothetical protein